MRVGIVGTGEMGRPLVDRLRGAGFDVTAFARRPEVRAQLEGAGVPCVDDVVALARGRDVVIIYVYSGDQVRSVDTMATRPMRYAGGLSLRRRRR